MSNLIGFMSTLKNSIPTDLFGNIPFRERDQKKFIVCKSIKEVTQFYLSKSKPILFYSETFNEWAIIAHDDQSALPLSNKYPDLVVFSKRELNPLKGISKETLELVWITKLQLRSTLLELEEWKKPPKDLISSVWPSKADHHK